MTGWTMEVGRTLYLHTLAHPNSEEGLFSKEGSFNQLPKRRRFGSCSARLAIAGMWFWLGNEMIHLMVLPNPDPMEGRPEHGGR